MKYQTIMHGERYQLVSYGNGVAYEIREKDKTTSLFVQGDDATTLKQELDAIEAAFPEMSIDDVLARLWEPYR